MPVCSCCKGTEVREFHREDDIPLWQCLRCGTLFFDVVLSGFQNDNSHFDPGKVLSWQRWLRQLPWFPLQQGQWLDFGSGYGEFALALGQFNPELKVSAFEPDTTRQNDRVSFIPDWTKQKWDVISLMQVWSHLSDPQETLLQLREQLNPGGWLLLQTGNAAAVSVADYPNKYFPGRHLHFGNIPVIVQMASRAGFTVRYQGSDPYPVMGKGLRTFREIIATLLVRRPYRLKHYGGPYQNVWFWLQKAG